MTHDEAVAFCDARRNPQQGLTIDTWMTAEKTERHQISYWCWITKQEKFRINVIGPTLEGAAARALEEENRFREANKMPAVAK